MTPRVVRAYREEGYVLRLGSPRLPVSGVQPLAALRYIPNDTGLPPTDLGLPVRDLWTLELIGRELVPKTGLVIGNAFGVGTLSMADTLRPISVDAIDAEVQEETRRWGSELTRRVAARLGLDVVLTRGYAPRDLDAACRHEAYDLLFVDGLHTNVQIIADFLGILPRLAPRCAVLFHDVGLMQMDDGWTEIKRIAAGEGLEGHDLTYTDYGSTLLLRGLPELNDMLALTCHGLRDLNEDYPVGHGFRRVHPSAPAERGVCLVPPGGRLAFIGPAAGLDAYAEWINDHASSVAGIVPTDDAALPDWAQAHRATIDELAGRDVAGLVATAPLALATRAQITGRLTGVPLYPQPGLASPVQLVDVADPPRPEAPSPLVRRKEAVPCT